MIEGVGVTDAVAVNVEMADLEGIELLVEELELVGSADLDAVNDESAEIDAWLENVAVALSIAVDDAVAEDEDEGEADAETDAVIVAEFDGNEETVA